ncbi:MAG: hypothetical protein ABSC48_16705 [Terracidiphilus sp.]
MTAKGAADQDTLRSENQACAPCFWGAGADGTVHQPKYSVPAELNAAFGRRFPCFKIKHRQMKTYCPLWGLSTQNHNILYFLKFSDNVFEFGMACAKKVGHFVEKG